MKLSPQSNSGESGTATLIKQGEKQTKVTLDVTGASGSQPVHIHKGTCAQLDPKPAFPLSPVVNGKSETVVNASLDDLQKGYAIKRREWRSRLSPRARSTARGRRREPSKRHHESSASTAYALPIHYLRTLADSRRIIEAARGARRAVVLGASFIGLEVAASLRARALDVHVVAPGQRPLERTLGPQLGDLVRALHESHGVVFHLGQTPRGIERRQALLQNGGRSLRGERSRS